MNTTTSVLVFVGLSLITLSKAKQSYFRKVADDKKPITALVPVGPAISLVKCASVCERTDKCNGFGFSKTQALCQLGQIHAHVNIKDQLKEGVGFKFYTSGE